MPQYLVAIAEGLTTEAGELPIETWMALADAGFREVARIDYGEPVKDGGACRVGCAGIVGRRVTRVTHLVVKARCEGSPVRMAHEPHDPDEIVTLYWIDRNGAQVEHAVPRWVLDAIQQGRTVTWYGGGTEIVETDDDGNVTRRVNRSSDDLKDG